MTERLARTPSMGDFRQGFWIGFMAALMLVGIALSVAAHP